jgi:tRNA(Arg) A34 adenosine deaminase TadA
MHLALEQAAAAAELGEVPVGAVVVLEGEVIASAHNRREIDASPSAHAEFIAITAAAERLGRWRLSDCTVYVTLEPCLMCAGLMHQARIARCVYGAPDPKAGALGSLYAVHEDARLNHTFSVEAGVCAEESAQLLSNFFARLRTKSATPSSGYVTTPHQPNNSPGHPNSSTSHPNSPTSSISSISHSGTSSGCSSTPSCHSRTSFCHFSISPCHSRESGNPQSVLSENKNQSDSGSQEQGKQDRYQGYAKSDIQVQGNEEHTHG